VGSLKLLFAAVGYRLLLSVLVLNAVTLPGAAGLVELVSFTGLEGSASGGTTLSGLRWRITDISFCS
jgi:hypothetical protein